MSFVLNWKLWTRDWRQTCRDWWWMFSAEPSVKFFLSTSDCFTVKAAEKHYGILTHGA